MSRIPTALAALAALLALASASGPAQAAGLGRLFFTPEQRRGRDRQAGLEDSATLVINGVMRRSDGKATVWINGAPQALSHSKIHVLLSPRNPARITLGIAGGITARLRVGESLDRATGERRSGLAGGSIAIHGGAQ